MPFFSLDVRRTKRTTDAFRRLTRRTLLRGLLAEHRGWYANHTRVLIIDGTKALWNGLGNNMNRWGGLFKLAEMLQWAVYIDQGGCGPGSGRKFDPHPITVRRGGMYFVYNYIQRFLSLSLSLSFLLSFPLCLAMLVSLLLRADLPR